MSPPEHKPRFSAEITPEQAHILSQILPHGTRNQLTKVYVNGLIRMHQIGGMNAIGLIVTEAIDINQVLQVGLKETREQKIQSLKNKLKDLQKV
jgi:hypothetical protein